MGSAQPSDRRAQARRAPLPRGGRGRHGTGVHARGRALQRPAAGRVSPRRV